MSFFTASLRGVLTIGREREGGADGRRRFDRDDGGLDGGDVRVRGLVGPDMNLADALELVLSVALLVYLVYVLVHPERF